MISTVFSNYDYVKIDGVITSPKIGEWITTDKSIDFGGFFLSSGEMIKRPPLLSKKFRLIFAGNDCYPARWEIEESNQK